MGYTTPMTFVAFGVTGDLMRLKILPALRSLHGKGLLPAGTRILGVSRRSWSDADLRHYLRDALPGSTDSFLSLFTFLQGDAENQETFAALTRLLGGDEALIYFSLAPSLYRKAFARMRDAGFGERPGVTKVMVEKPFGVNGTDAERLYAQLRSIVAGENIYLVDHYLAKEWVRKLGALPVSREDIARVHLRLLETVGVEGRGALYDQLGALRDVCQNHLLQMLACVLSPEDRAEALERLKPLSPAQIATATLRAQYEGYRDIPGVVRESQTETYCKIRTVLDAPGWQGVEVVLEAGKLLPRASKEVVITLKDKSTMIIAEPREKADEYETLLVAAMRGDRGFFPSLREVRAQWRFIDPILAAWGAGMPELVVYPPGSAPP